ncbi:MAG: class I SAM-dependent methyltransferase [Candidatus Heimdallarchaeota archaeon]
MKKIDTLKEPQQKSAPSQSIAEVYNEIAESFNEKRSKPWCEVVEFIKTLPSTEQPILDLGCGNGRHVIALLEHGFTVVAMDVSFKILEIAKARISEKNAGERAWFVNADGTKLPFRKKTFAAIIMIAVIHHLETTEKRKKVLKELAEKLDEEGVAFISCWLRTHPRFKKEDLRGEILAGKKDIYVPWTLSNGKKIMRYYYLFEPEELEQLCKETGLEILVREKAHHNLFLTLRKQKGTKKRRQEKVKAF